MVYHERGHPVEYVWNQRKVVDSILKALQDSGGWCFRLHCSGRIRVRYWTSISLSFYAMHCQRVGRS